MIALQEVSKWYFGQSKILDSVSLRLNQGEFLYVAGGTGAGKSSLLRILASEEGPNLGRVSLFGYDLARVSPSTLRSIRQNIGYVPQNLRLIPDLTVYENVAVSLQTAGKRKVGRNAKGKVIEMLESVGLAHKKDEAARSLSGGEAQRVAVARAFVRNPDLIIADEPTGAQDRPFTWSLTDLFVRANQSGATVVVATHDAEIVARVRRKCAVLKGGHVFVEGGACTY